MAWCALCSLTTSDAYSGSIQKNTCHPHTIVVDPGHGGQNSGAQNPDGHGLEKQFTLDFSILLGKELSKLGLHVVMTRSTDKPLTLRRRMQVAHDEDADRFISIHANASTTQSHLGYETYYLSAKAANTAAMGLRHGEGLKHLSTTKHIRSVLHDSLSVKSVRDSKRFAMDMQKALSKARPKSKNRGVKQGNHHVLLGATMPAILMEIGFIDHPVEGPELLNSDIQQKIAHTLAKGLFSNVCSQNTNRCIPNICKPKP